METKQEQQKEQSKKSWFDRWYKFFFLIPIAVLILSLVYLGLFFSQHNDFILKDASLAGGTTITLKGDIDSNKLETALKGKFPDASIRKLTDIRTGKSMASIIETSSKPEEIKPEIENILGYKLTDENSSIEFAGPTLSQGFYIQLLKALLLSFLLMSLVVFFLFGEEKINKVYCAILTLTSIRLTFPRISFISVLIAVVGIILIGYSFYLSKSRRVYVYSLVIASVSIAIYVINLYPLILLIIIILFVLYLLLSPPSIAVIFAAFSDVIMSLALIDYLGIRLSAAGIAAFLMLIGYSVDTDVLLTTRALKKKEGTLNERIFSAFKTGIFMTTTALITVLPAFFIVSGLPDSFRQIFLIISLGLLSDVLNTWLTNVGIIKWYCDRKGIR